MNNMREYLKGFLEEFEYPRECASLMLGCYDEIVGDGQRRDLLSELLSAYEKDENISFFVIEEYVNRICNGLSVHEYCVWLLVYQLMTKRQRELYLDRGIPLRIWRDSMRDLLIKAEECRELKGIYGTFVGSWFPKFFRLKRFALGRLQFEITSFQEKEFLCSDGRILREGDTVIGVHIPRSSMPLSKENCDASYAEAKDFFADLFNGGKTVFTCNSWMLYPKNSEILHKRSNVRRFGEEYELVSVTQNGAGEYPDGWRIFGVECTEDLEALPEDSFLQRAYKSYMLSGGVTGRAYGVKLL